MPQPHDRSSSRALALLYAQSPAALRNLLRHQRNRCFPKHTAAQFDGLPLIVWFSYVTAVNDSDSHGAVILRYQALPTRMPVRRSSLLYCEGNICLAGSAGNIHVSAIAV